MKKADLDELLQEEKKSKFKNDHAILHIGGYLETGLTRKDVANRRKNGLLPEGSEVFDSKLEALYYRDEILPKLGKTIREVQLQPKYILTEANVKFGVRSQAMTYSPDFLVTYTDGTQACIDTKGHEDERFKVKRKVFDDRYPNLKLIILKHVIKFGGWITVENYAALKAKEKKQMKELGTIKPNRKRTMRRVRG